MDHVEFLNKYDVATLTDMVEVIPDVPSLLSPYFEAQGMDTTFAVIDRTKRGLHLVPDTKREYAGPVATPGDKRSGLIIEAAHLLETDFLTPMDIQNERAVNREGLTTVDMKVTEKLAAMRRNIAATLEWHRVGAVKGKVLDADGSTVLYDLYDKFGITPNEEESVSFPTDAAGATNVLSQQFEDLTDRVELALGGNAYTGVMAIVGKDFWNKLTTNPMVREAYNMWTQRRSAYGLHAKNEPFEYGGISWVRYNKAVGGNVLVEPGAAHVFPVGPGIMKHYYAPALYMDTVNTMGQAYYSRAESTEMNRAIKMEVQSNPLTLCMFPEALFTLKAA